MTRIRIHSGQGLRHPFIAGSMNQPRQSSCAGGVTKTNAKEFFANGFDGVGVGSNLYSKELIRAKDFQGLENLAREYVSEIKKA